MLNMMLTVFLVGGGMLGGSLQTPSDAYLIGDRVELAIDDPRRRAEIKQILTELETEIRKFDGLLVEAGNDLRDLYQDHAAGSRQTQRRLEKINLEWYVSQQRNIALRERLKQSTDAGEWARIFDSN